jgi:hypothetical protein
VAFRYENFLCHSENAHSAGYQPKGKRQSQCLPAPVVNNHPGEQLKMLMGHVLVYFFILANARTVRTM